MPFPVRCFTCGKVIKWTGKKSDKDLDKMGVRRICCRARYKGYNPTIDEDRLMYSSPRESRDAEVFLNPE